MCRTLETFCMHLNIYKSRKIDSYTHKPTQTYRHRHRSEAKTFSRLNGQREHTDGRTDGRNGPSPKPNVPTSDGRCHKTPAETRALTILYYIGAVIGERGRVRPIIHLRIFVLERSFDIISTHQPTSPPESVMGVGRRS